MASDVVAEKHPLGKRIEATGTVSGGTGKYTGIAGTSRFSPNDAGYPSQTNYLLNGSVRGDCKLP